MITKPSITFLTADSDALLITDTNTILTAMTGNTNYPTPSPALTAVTTALNDFTTTLANAADGGITLTSIKNDKRAELVALLRELANYVQGACNGDLTVLLSSGFPIQKPQRFPIGVLPAPTNVTVSLGALSGELDAAMPPVFGAAIYNWRLTATSAPTVVVQSTQTTAARNTFTGLTPGVVYTAEVNAVGSAGPSDWSNPVSKMAV
jgi:Fibronectin type III domain